MIDSAAYISPVFYASCQRYMNFTRMMPFNYDPATAFTIMAWSEANSFVRSILIWEALCYD